MTTKENCKKLTKIGIVAGIGILVLGLLWCVPVTRNWMCNTITLKKAKLRPMDGAYLKFKEAERSRLTAEMLIQAKAIQPEDAELSALLFKRCGLFAALQQNKELFAEVLAVYPDAKAMECFFIADSASAKNLLPQVVSVSSLEEARKLPAGQLATWGKYIVECYENISSEQATEIAEIVNAAREQLSETKLFDAAMSLSAYKAKDDIPSQFTVQALLTEAIDFAEIHTNVDVLNSISNIAKEKNLLDEKALAELEADAKSLAATRGSRYSDWDDDYDSSYSRSKPKNFTVPIAVFIVAFFVLVILYYTLKILFGLAVIICAIAVLAAILSC